MWTSLRVYQKNLPDPDAEVPVRAFVMEPVQADALGVQVVLDAVILVAAPVLAIVLQTANLLAVVAVGSVLVAVQIAVPDVLDAPAVLGAIHPARPDAVLAAEDVPALVEAVVLAALDVRVLAAEDVPDPVEETDAVQGAVAAVEDAEEAVALPAVWQHAREAAARVPDALDSVMDPVQQIVTWPVGRPA